MFYLPTAGGREETSLLAMRMRSVNVFKMVNMSFTKPHSMQHVLSTIWPQIEQFLTKNVSFKHCKSIRRWEVEQVLRTISTCQHLLLLQCLCHLSLPVLLLLVLSTPTATVTYWQSHRLTKSHFAKSWIHKSRFKWILTQRGMLP